MDTNELQVIDLRGSPLERGRMHGEILPLAYLAPDLVTMIIEGRQPGAMTLQSLTEKPLPRAWEHQRRLFAKFGWSRDQDSDRGSLFPRATFPGRAN
jgi:hypothetical protein